MTQLTPIYRPNNTPNPDQSLGSNHHLFSADTLSSSQMRILAVHTCILRLGPISVTEIAKVLTLPKSSVSRAISKLEQANWVEKRHRNGAIQVSAQFKAMTMNTDGHNIVWHKIVSVLSPLARKLGFGFELAAMTSFGKIQTVGCSDTAMVADKLEHNQLSVLGAACLSGYSDHIDREFEMSLQRTDAFLCLESYAIFKRYLSKFRADGAHHDEKKRHYIRALKLPSGETGALRLVQGTANNLCSCVAVCEKEIALLLEE